MMAKKALVVDDSPTIRNLVSFCMEREGFEVTTAIDGLHALDEAALQSFDVIITDVNMPQMDGIAFIRELRTRQEGKHIPVLVLTVLNSAEKKAEAKAAGATAWLEKPFEPEVLVKAVKLVISSERAKLQDKLEDMA